MFSTLPHRPLFAATDFHLGSPDYRASRDRERRVVKWLEYCAAENPGGIFLLGDTFDFWFEYKSAVPRGFTRLLGCLATIHDAGIPVAAWTGNHDMWIFDYLPEETGITLFRTHQRLNLAGISTLVGHGDGLGPGEGLYKFLKKVFANRLCQEAFGFLHPNVGMWIAHNWSNGSRSSHGTADMAFKGEKEYLWQWCKEQHMLDPAPELYLFGHRHLPLWLPVGDKAHYLNLGDWFRTGLYAKFREGSVEVFTEHHQPITLQDGVLQIP